MKLKLLISILALILAGGANADDYKPPFERPSSSLSRFFEINVNAGGAFGPGIPIDQPTFCFGENDLGQCVPFFGSAKACENINPCSPQSSDAVAAAIGRTVIQPRDLFFCYGLNSLDQCTLFLGSKEACDTLEPCPLGLTFDID